MLKSSKTSEREHLKFVTAIFKRNSVHNFSFSKATEGLRSLKCYSSYICQYLHFFKIKVKLLGEVTLKLKLKLVDLGKPQIIVSKKCVFN